MKQPGMITATQPALLLLLLLCNAHATCMLLTWTSGHSHLPPLLLQPHGCILQTCHAHSVHTPPLPSAYV